MRAVVRCQGGVAHGARRLTVRKRRLAHGAWLPYLAEIGIPARTAQKAMQIAKCADSAHLLPSIEETLEHLRLPAPERRLAECVRLWPGLAARMSDTATRAAVERYAEITAPVFEGGKDWPTDDELSWAASVERLFEAA